MLSCSEIDLHIDTLVQSVDFSKVSFDSKKEINFDSFDLSWIPSSDFSKIDNFMESLQLDDVAESVKKSRIKNKDFCLSAISKIEDYKSKYQSRLQKLLNARLIKQILFDMSEKAPTSCKLMLYHKAKTLSADISEISYSEENREFILQRISERLVSESRKYVVKNLKETLSVKWFDVNDIQYVKSSATLDAMGECAFERFGRCTSCLVGSVFRAKANIPVMEWPFMDEMENVIKFAKSIHLRELAFSGSSTVVLNDLNVLTKLGIPFTIKEFTKEDDWGDVTESISYPVAVVTLA